MGIVAQLFGSGAPKDLVSLQGNGEFAVDAECEGQHQAALEKIVRRTPDEVCEVPCRAILVPETDGRVSVRIRDQMVGYLKEHMGSEYRDRCASLGFRGSAVCDAVVVGGWCGHDGEEGTFGVRLDLVWPIKPAAQ
jgi:hypothetical protein